MAASQIPARWRHWLRPSWRLSRWHGLALLPAATWIALSVGLFLYFRYVVPSPWRGQAVGHFPDGIGQSWSQYKVTIWASFAVVSVAAALLVGAAVRPCSRFLRVAVILVLAAWCGTGLGWNYLLAGRRGKGPLIDTGTRNDPLTLCLAVRQMVAAIPAGQWIYLDWPADGSRGKFRELLVYYLSDHPLVSDWRDDGYLAPYTTLPDARRARADCQWVLRYRPPSSPTDNTLPALEGMTLEQVR